MGGLQAFFQSEWFRTLVFLISTPAMIVLIRMSGETFEDHTYFFLVWMFAFQTICGSIHCAYLYFTGAMKLDSELDTSPRSWIVLAAMAFFITGNAAGTFATSAYISGPLQTILGMSTILAVPLFDRLLLGAKVNMIQLLGIAICVLGIAITVIYESENETESNAPNSPLAMILLVVSLLPMPVVNMIAENWFGDRPLWHPMRNKHADFEWGTLRYVFLQIPWHIPYYMVYMAAGIPSGSDLGSNLSSGWKCMMLFDSTSNESEDCSMVLWIVVATGVTTYIQILSSFYVSVNESAAYSIILLGVSKFIANFIFGWEALMGKYTEKPGPTIWVSLFVSTIGLGVYRYGKYRASPEGGESNFMDDLRGLGPSLASWWASVIGSSGGSSSGGEGERESMDRDAAMKPRMTQSIFSVHMWDPNEKPTWFTRTVLGSGSTSTSTSTSTSKKEIGGSEAAAYASKVTKNPMASSIMDDGDDDL